MDRGVASVLPLPVASTGSRVWLGWWCIVPLLLSVIWLFINPIFFASPRSTSTLVYGLIALDAVATVTGVLTVEGGKLWYLDRMALLFDEVELRPEVARCEH